MHRSPVTYPIESLRDGLQGTVIVQLTLDAAGAVSGARVISGPEQLRKPVLQSVLDWHFARESAGATREVKVTFNPEAAGFPAGGPVSGATGLAAGILAARPRVTAPGMTLPALTTLSVEGLSDEARNELLAALPLHVGDVPSVETLDKLNAAVRNFDEHLSISILQRNGGTEIRLATPSAPLVQTANPTLTVSSLPTADGVSRVNVAAGKLQLVQQVNPVYPPLAKEARIQGVVRLRAAIAENGAVREVALTSGHPLLAQAALEAVRQWVYKPVLVGEKAVEAITDIDVNFTLPE
jgi:TonB family protein